MKNILYIVPHLGLSGPTNQLYGLIKNLDRNKLQASILTLSPEESRTKLKAFEDLNVPLSCLNLSRYQSLFIAKRKAAERIKNTMPDVIHSHGIRPDILVSSLKYDGEKICTIHNFPQFDYIMKYGKFTGRLMTTFHTRALKKFDICIGVSKAVKCNLENCFNIKNSEFIHNGVDTDVFNRVSTDRKQQLRETLGLPREAKIWICSGRLSQRKDPMAIIDSFTEKYHDDMKTILIFLGDGELEILSKEKAEGHSNILFRGSVNNVSDYLKAGDFFVSSSHAEGLPNSVIEALACGLPVLLSDIEPHKEIIEMNPAIGKIYQLGNRQSFINAFDYLENADYGMMSDTAYNLVNKELSAKAMSEKYQKIYLSWK